MDEAVADWIAAHADLLERWENIKSYYARSGGPPVSPCGPRMADTLEE